jgi:hypothetical protein
MGRVQGRLDPSAQFPGVKYRRDEQRCCWGFFYARLVRRG